jgi:hypothetical protein
MTHMKCSGGSDVENVHPNKKQRCRKRKGCCFETIHDFQINNNDDQLIAWINSTIETNFDTLKDALGGAAACQIVDKLHHTRKCDGNISSSSSSSDTDAGNEIFTRSQWRQIDWLPTQSFICANNYKILVNVLHKKLNIEKHIDIVSLATQRIMKCRTFYCWLKHYYVTEMKKRKNHGVTNTYFTRVKRSVQKNGKDFQNLVDDANKNVLHDIGHHQHQHGRKKKMNGKTIKISHLLKIDHTTLSKFDRKIQINWPSNLKLKQRKMRLQKQAAGGGKTTKTTKDVVFNMFYGDQL